MAARECFVSWNSCCWAAQRAFTKALFDGRLDDILAEERERAKRAAYADGAKIENRLEGLSC
jgi:hypothetical protein